MSILASSSGVFGCGRADSRRRCCSCLGVISWAGGTDASGRRDRTDQVGLDRRALVSTVSLVELYARADRRGYRCWLRRACRKAPRQHKQINLDISEDIGF